ncbi:MAG: RnfABCDGE type electron transport complex subunit G [Anaerovoracaceae bacterium]|jgi:electron transport complex protein RnfG
MKTSNFKEMIAPSLVLVIICLVITAALAITYQVTKPIINNINMKNANLARAEVLPEGAGGFTAVDADLIENVVDVYQADNKSGMTFTTIDKGFGGQIEVMTGINSNGEIQGVKITSHSETPGLGTKAMTPEHLSQYKGQAAITNTGEADATNIDAITGATISSNAIFRAVETALAQYEQLGGTQ